MDIRFALALQRFVLQNLVGSRKQLQLKILGLGA